MNAGAGVDPLNELIAQLRKLPGIGARSAERIAFHLLKTPPRDALALADAVRELKEQVRPCTRCFNLATAELCAICADPRRDAATVFVVEQPKDLITLENTGLIHGVYHVLMGHIAPTDGVGADDLTIAALVERCKHSEISELVLATNPNLEGDATALHITEALAGVDVRITRLARGLAPGASLEYANRAMLEEALRGRRPAE